MLTADVDGNETVIILMSEEMKGAVTYVRSTLLWKGMLRKACV